jgi:hypothetical protein
MNQDVELTLLGSMPRTLMPLTETSWSPGQIPPCTCHEEDIDQAYDMSMNAEANDKMYFKYQK